MKSHGHRSPLGRSQFIHGDALLKLCHYIELLLVKVISSVFVRQPTLALQMTYASLEYTMRSTLRVVTNGNGVHWCKATGSNGSVCNDHARLIRAT